VTTPREDEVVAITAAARARELRVENKPRTRITTKGKGQVTTRRSGLPPTGAEPGVTYSDVEVSVEIGSDPPDEAPR
jgi:hypothetical protein